MPGILTVLARSDRGGREGRVWLEMAVINLDACLSSRNVTLKLCKKYEVDRWIYPKPAGHLLLHMLAGGHGLVLLK